MLSLHPDKTQFIVFSNSNIVKNKEINLFIDMNNENENNPSFIKKIKRISSHSDFPAIQFLGVLFDPDLNFKMQIRHVSSKISKSLYILRSVKNILSEKALKTPYYSLVHCHLVYGIHIWSSTTVGNLNDLKVKQKNAIRTITLSKYNAHTLPLFKKLKILPLDNLIYFFKLQFMSKYVHGLLPVSFNNVWVKREEWRAETFSLTLRNSENFYIPTPLLAQTERHPYFLFPKLWSDFSNNDIKIIRNHIEFNVALKNDMLKELPENVNCTRLFCHCCSNIPAVNEIVGAVEPP